VTVRARAPLGAVTKIRRRVPGRQAQRCFDFRRPNQILPFNVPSRDDPHQLPGVRATNPARIVPGLTQQAFSGEVRAEVLYPVVRIAVTLLLVFPLREYPQPNVVTLGYY
jgi:hypothetical protein